MNDNVDGMVEAARVFGNLSRSQGIRDFLTTKKGMFNFMAFENMSCAVFFMRKSSAVSLYFNISLHPVRAM